MTAANSTSQYCMLTPTDWLACLLNCRLPSSVQWPLFPNTAELTAIFYTSDWLLRVNCCWPLPVVRFLVARSTGFPILRLSATVSQQQTQLLLRFRTCSTSVLISVRSRERWGSRDFVSGRGSWNCCLLCWTKFVLNSAVFCDATTYSLLEIYRRFGIMQYLHFHCRKVSQAEDSGSVCCFDAELIV
jgi:hypothetical protein